MSSSEHAISQRGPEEWVPRLKAAYKARRARRAAPSTGAPVWRAPTPPVLIALETGAAAELDAPPTADEMTDETEDMALLASEAADETADEAAVMALLALPPTPPTAPKMVVEPVVVVMVLPSEVKVDARAEVVMAELAPLPEADESEEAAESEALAPPATP